VVVGVLASYTNCFPSEDRVFQYYVKKRLIGSQNFSGKRDLCMSSQFPVV